MAWTYPTDDLDKPRKVLALLGSLWTEAYDGAAFLEATVDARNNIARQAYDDLLQDGELISRLKMPIWHTRNWYALFVKASEMTSAAAIWHFDDPDLPHFDAAPGFTFDVPVITGAVGTEAPPDFHNVLMISNRINDPSVVLHKDIDFVISQEGALVFRENPFLNPLFPKSAEFQGGEVDDVEIVLWLSRPEFDWGLIFAHFGYVLGLRLPTTEGYKTLVNLVMDAHVRATAQVDVERTVGAIYGIPLVREAEEVIQDIQSDSRHLLVVTDYHVYEHRLGATPVVAVGDLVTMGQPMIDAFVSYDMRDGIAFPDVPAITLPMGMLAPSFVGEISWENSLVPVTVTGTPGNERVEWPLGGRTDDVAHFWDTVHIRGLIYGDSLYELMEDYYGTVPPVINPMEFLIANVLRNNCMLIVIQTSGISEAALDTASDQWLRKIIPPHVTLIVIIAMPALGGSVTIGGGGSGTTGYGMEPVTASIGGIGGSLNIW